MLHDVSKEPKPLFTGPFIQPERIAHNGRFIRWDYYFLTAKFVDALAGELGLVADIDNRESKFPAARIPYKEKVMVTASYEIGAKMGKVRLSAYMLGTDKLPHHQRPVFGSITVDSNRPIKGIANDVRRKILAYADTILADAETNLTAMAGRRAAFGEKLAKLREKYPLITFDRKNPDALEASIYYNSQGGYFNGDLLEDGHITLQRVSVPGEAGALGFFELFCGKGY